MASSLSLSSKVRSCVAELNNLCAALSNPSCHYLDQIPPSAVDDESRRFKVWAHNIGALQGPHRQSSMDYRLRAAPQIRQQVLRLLDRLSFSATQVDIPRPRNLYRASLICADKRPNRVEDNSDLDDEMSSDEPQETERQSLEVSEIRELFLAISGSVNRLFKLSMAIRNPTPRARYEKLASIEPLSSFFDILHVREKFPGVENHPWLADRLGKANTQRRDYFRYRRRHKERLAKEAGEEYEQRLNEGPRATENQDGQKDLDLRGVHHTLRNRRAESSIGSTAASTYVPPPTDIEKFEEASDTGQSESSYATSVEEDNSKALHIPLPPAEFDDGLPFECPYCYTIQSPNNRQAWKKHVFDDLQPYICTFKSCPAKPFTSRHAWFDHELQVHRKEWVCSLCEHSVFRSSDSFRLHLQDHHNEEVTDRQILALIDLCEEPLNTFRLEDCLLCKEWASSIKARELAANPKARIDILVVNPAQFRRHLASHLEQLALFALPRDHGGEDASKIDSNDAVVDASSDEVSIADLSAEGSDSGGGGESVTSLLFAVISGEVIRVRKLLEEGADANARSRNSDYALHAAARLGFDVIARLLIEHGADVNAFTGHDHVTAIEVARSKGHNKVVDLLLESGAESHDDNHQRGRSTSPERSFADKESAAIFIQKTWRVNHFMKHPAEIIPPWLCNIHSFGDAAWMVHRLLRNEKTELFVGLDPDARNRRAAYIAEVERCEGGFCGPQISQTWYCSNCGSFFCDICWQLQVPHTPGKVGIFGYPHEKSDPRVVKTLNAILDPHDDQKELRELHRLDEDTTWFSVIKNPNPDPNTGLMRISFKDYGRYAALMAETRPLNGELRCPQIISFVGQSNAGKSTIVKMLIAHEQRKLPLVQAREFPSPIVKGAINALPTSSDVHLYSDPGTYFGKIPMLYADSEGLEGGEEVLSAAQSKMQHTSGQQNKLKTSNRGVSRDIKWATEDFMSERQYVVRHLYPRLLYTLSDVIVFVLHNPKTFQSVLRLLLDWTSSSLEESTNQPFLPHAIIVLNKTDPAIPQEEWDLEKTTENLMTSVKLATHLEPAISAYVKIWNDKGRKIDTMTDLIQCYYSSVAMVKIPAKGRYMLIDQQIEKLHQQISNRCDAARHSKGRIRFLLSADELDAYLQAVFNQFSKELDVPFDFVK